MTWGLLVNGAVDGGGLGVMLFWDGFVRRDSLICFARPLEVSSGEKVEPIDAPSLACSAV